MRAEDWEFEEALERTAGRYSCMPYVKQKRLIPDILQELQNLEIYY